MKHSVEITHNKQNNQKRPSIPQLHSLLTANSINRLHLNELFNAARDRQAVIANEALRVRKAVDSDRRDLISSPRRERSETMRHFVENNQHSLGIIEKSIQTLDRLMVDDMKEIQTIRIKTGKRQVY